MICTDSLQESQTLPSAKSFAECKKSGTRQRLPLPSGKPNTRQSPFCRVPDTRQSQTFGNQSLRRVSATRQNKTLGKALTGQTAPMAVIYAECAPSGTRQTVLLCRVPHPLALGKDSFAECRAWHSANIFFFGFFVPFF